jgi:hypothetical protein
MIYNIYSSRKRIGEKFVPVRNLRHEISTFENFP